MRSFHPFIGKSEYGMDHNQNDDYPELVDHIRNEAKKFIID